MEGLFGKSIFSAGNFKNVSLFRNVAVEKCCTSGKHLLQIESHMSYSKKVPGWATERLATVNSDCGIYHVKTRSKKHKNVLNPLILHMELLTYLIVVDFHGGVGQRAKNSYDRDFPDGHLTHRLQVLIPLLNIHTDLLTGGCNQLEEGREWKQGG